MRQIPFYKPSLGQNEMDEVLDCVGSGWLTTGPKTKQYEAELAQYIGQAHAVAVNSCTAALHLALEAIGLQAGDTVVVPTLTFAATAEVVRYFGANPLLVDCRPEDLNLDPADAQRRIEAALAKGERIKAIIPVHYGGQIGDVAGVAALAARFKLDIIEDAAHCCPAYYRKAAQLHRARAERAQLYSEMLQGVEELMLPRTMPDRIHGWHLYPIRLNLERLKTDRAAIIAEMKSAGIGASVHWMPLHMHPYY